MRAHVRTRERNLFRKREIERKTYKKKNLQKESSSCRLKLKLKAFAFHSLINHSLVFILVFDFEHHH